MNGEIISVFWDESQIWGILVLRALTHFTLKFRLVNSQQIRSGILEKNRNGILIVPGGSARLKAERLGKEGLCKIKNWLLAGGQYLGFCGGAGLALSEMKDHASLGICPLRRANFSDRETHFISGYVNCLTKDKKTLKLPVWWPGRFAYKNDAKIEILAKYLSPDNTLWLKDEPVVNKFCTENDLSRIFPYNEPLVIYGKNGNGKFVLSYAHLESPHSPQANQLLMEILSDIFEISPQQKSMLIWPLFYSPVPWSDNDFSITMFKNWQLLMELMKKGLNIGIFSPRFNWLYGWKQGFPGIICHNLLAYFWVLSEINYTNPVKSIWKVHKVQIQEKILRFLNDMQIFLNLWLHKNEKSDIRMTMEKSRIFGHPITGGGLAGEILKNLEELLFYSLKENPE